MYEGLPRWLGGKESACQCRRQGFDSGVRKITWRREWQLIPVYLLVKSHGQRSLVGYSPWDYKGVRYNWEAEHTHTHTHTHRSIYEMLLFISGTVNLKLSLLVTRWATVKSFKKCQGRKGMSFLLGASVRTCGTWGLPSSNLVSLSLPGLPCSSNGKESAYYAGDWVRKILSSLPEVLLALLSVPPTTKRHS